MKYSLILTLLLGLVFHLNAQHKFSAALEISAGISESTQPKFSSLQNEGVYFGRNIFLKGGYELTDHLEFTLGLGLMRFNAVEYSFFGTNDVDFIESRIEHHLR